MVSLVVLSREIKRGDMATKTVKRDGIEYYCDVCGKEVTDINWSYGGHASATEQMEKCHFCGKDTCPDCHEQFDFMTICNQYVCTECLPKLVDIKQNYEEYRSQVEATRKAHALVEKAMLDDMKLQSKPK